ncbi:glycosyltransferase family 2 protein [Ornithobacterium rhinotracheale]
MKKISILIPCYNEEQSLPLMYRALLELIEKVSSYEWELFFVNDGSSDSTLRILQELHLKDDRVNYVDLSRNFGKENAMLAGFDNITGDALVIMDADLQHPPSVVVEMIKEWENGYEDVYAKRITRGKESWFRKRLSLLYYSILQKTARYDILQNVGDFRLLDKSCVNSLKRLRESERYTKGMFSWIGYKKKEILFEQQDRLAGVSTWNTWRLFHLAVEGITSFTVAPLKFSTIGGLFISFIAFIYMLYILFKTIFYGESVQGYPTLIIIILFLGGVQLLALGIIGEYLGRVFNETKKRPVYIIREKNGEKI